MGDDVRGSSRPVLLMVAAVSANCVAGLLYIWSLFIVPLEGGLSLDRGDLGLVSSLALISFTVGVSLFPLIQRKIGAVSAAMLAFALMAGGHMAFGMLASWPSLIIGYGMGFGFGSGLAYGLALSLASSMPDRIRAIGIGLSLGAFALSGIVLPILLDKWIAQTAPDEAFLLIGMVTLVAGMAVVLVLAGSRSGIPRAQAATTSGPIAFDRPFVILSLIFFLICFTGITVVSHAATMASAAGISLAGYAATALTLGYLGGSLFGAPLAEKIGERRVLLLLGLLSLAGVLAMLSTTAAILFPGAALIGMTFGGAGSIFPVLLGIRYGPENISRMFGRMIIAYGLAGLVAPGLAGMLFELARNYTATLGLCGFLAILALLAIPALDKTTPLTRADA